jgi:hypothetical protein
MVFEVKGVSQVLKGWREELDHKEYKANQVLKVSKVFRG